MFGKEGEMKNTLDCIAFWVAFALAAIALAAGAGG